MRSPKPEGPGVHLELDDYMEDFGRYFKGLSLPA